MIKLSNGHEIDYVVASGALAFSGRGWWWERPLVWLGLIKPEFFTVFIKTLTYEPRLGNLCWWKPWTWLPFSPWSCVRLLPGGAVNKVGLTNNGIDWWCQKVAPRLDFHKFPLAGSIFGDEDELVRMARMLNHFDLVALGVNGSCPNVLHLEQAEIIINCVKAVKSVSRHPLIVKVSVDQDYLAIAHGLKGVAEAIELNSVPWKTAFPDGQRSPLSWLERKVGGGGGGVSGKPAQYHNWAAVEALAKQGSLPVIGPSVMEFEDMEKLRRLGAEAISFGAVHLRTPWKPTSFVTREMRRR